MRMLRLALVIALTQMGPVGDLEPAAPAAEKRAAAGSQVGRTSSARRWYAQAGLVAFNEGYRAWEQRDWQTTKDKMREALKEDPVDQPEANVKTGGAGWISPYVPSYYLCVARCRVDHCSENRDEILRLIKDADRRLLKEYQEACRNQGECPAEAP